MLERNKILFAIFFVIILMPIVYFLFLKIQNQIVLEESNIKDGVMTLYYSDGHVKSKTVFKNGKKNGKSVWFYSNGNYQKILYYYENELKGKSYYFKENGSLEKIVNHENGQANVVFQDSIKNHHTNSQLFSTSCSKCHNVLHQRDLLREIGVLKDSLKTGVLGIDSVHSYLTRGIFRLDTIKNPEMLNLQEVKSEFLKLDSIQKSKKKQILKSPKIKSPKV